MILFPPVLQLCPTTNTKAATDIDYAGLFSLLYRIWKAFPGQIIIATVSVVARWNKARLPDEHESA